MDSSRPTNLKRERNEQIYEQRKQGRSYSSIAREMGLSPNRVRQICTREQLLHDGFTTPLPEVPTCKEETALYRLIMSHKIEGFDERKRTARRLYGAILMHWQSPDYLPRRYDYPPLEFIHTIVVEPDCWCKVRGIGKNACILLTDIQRYLKEQGE